MIFKITKARPYNMRVRKTLSLRRYSLAENDIRIYPSLVLRANKLR